MIKIFRHNTVLQIIIILAVTLLLWLPSLIHPQAPVSGHNYAVLYAMLHSWLSTVPTVATILALLLTVGEGLWLNVILDNKGMLPSNTLMPTLLYIIAMSMPPSPIALTPILLVNACMLIALSQVTVHEDLALTTNQVFTAAMAIAIASLFFTPAIVMLIPLMVVFTIHNLYYWRYWTLLILGALAPLIIVGTIYYLTGRLYYTKYLLWLSLCNIGIRITPLSDMNAWSVVCNIVFIALIVVTLLWNLFNQNDKVQVFRKNSNVIMVQQLGSVIMLGYTTVFPVDTMLFAIPLTYMLTLFLMKEQSRTWKSDLLLIVVLVLTITARWAIR